jgi:hypothetical protein
LSGSPASRTVERQNAPITLGISTVIATSEKYHGWVLDLKESDDGA